MLSGGRRNAISPDNRGKRFSATRELVSLAQLMRQPSTITAGGPAVPTRGTGLEIKSDKSQLDQDDRVGCPTICISLRHVSLLGNDKRKKQRPQYSEVSFERSTKPGGSLALAHSEWNLSNVKPLLCSE